jgi:hypothetical protein
VAGHLAWEWCLRAGRKKCGGTCHCSRTTPQVALSCFDLYNTELRQIFPGRKYVMRNLAGPSFGCVHIFFSRSGNNAKGDVYCRRARERLRPPLAGVLTCFRIWARRSSLSCKQRVALFRTIHGAALACLCAKATTESFRRWSCYPA